MRCGSRSPPAASRPSGSCRACSMGGNHAPPSPGISQETPLTGDPGRGRAPAPPRHTHRPGVAFALRGSARSRCANRASRIRCTDQVSVGSKPRATLCSPCVPGSKRDKARLDAVFDALVIAGLEVQAVELVARTPVAAIERVGADEEDRRGHDLLALAGELEHQRIAHRRDGAIEERARQVGLVAVAQEGVGVQNPSPRRVRPASMSLRRRGLEPDALFGHAAPFALRLLALVRRERGEEVVEAAIAAIAPVELAVAAQQPAPRRPAASWSAASTNSRCTDETPRRSAAARLRPRAARRARAARQVAAHQQSRARGRRERRGDHELGVVGEAVARIGLRPREIEHEFAVGMGLQPGGGRRREPARVVQRDDERAPAGARTDALAVLERTQEFVPEERIAARGERIPARRIEARDALVDVDAQRHSGPRVRARSGTQPPWPSGTPSR